MLRRLLAQLGFTALIMALGSGAVFADAAPVSTPQPTDPGHTAVTTSGDGSVVVSTSQSTTTVGTSAGGSPSSGSSNPPSATPTPNDGQTAHTSTDSALSTNSPSSPDSNHPNAVTSSTIAPGHGGGSGSNTPAPVIIPVSDNALVASLQRAAYVSGLAPVEPILASTLATGITRHGPPKPPSAPVGLLNQLHVLLISTLVPASRFVSDGVIAAAASHAGLALVLVLLLASLVRLGLMLPANSYTARLRDSGFLGAARSDVANLLLFATPREMGSIGAGAPG